MEEPRPFQAEPQVQAMPTENEPAGEEEEEWGIHFTEDGDRYWFNYYTGESLWSPPPGWVDKAAPAAASTPEPAAPTPTTAPVAAQATTPAATATQDDSPPLLANSRADSQESLSMPNSPQLSPAATPAPPSPGPVQRAQSDEKPRLSRISPDAPAVLKYPELAYLSKSFDELENECKITFPN